jgi:hypothetical protein
MRAKQEVAATVLSGAGLGFTLKFTGHQDIVSDILS